MILFEILTDFFVIYEINHYNSVIGYVIKFLLKRNIVNFALAIITTVRTAYQNEWDHIL